MEQCHSKVFEAEADSVSIITVIRDVIKRELTIGG